MTFFSKYKSIVCYGLSLWLCFTTVALTHANSFTERRISVSQKLFRTLLVAKLNYQKDLSEAGTFYVNLIYQHNDILAKSMSDKLANELTLLHNKPVIIRHVSLINYLKTQEPKAIGSFLVENLSNEQLQKVIKHSINNQQILFSPFEGDVEQGVMAGLSVESKVRPFVNMHALIKSNVELKSFFIKVSKQYAP